MRSNSYPIFKRAYPHRLKALRALASAAKSKGDPKVFEDAAVGVEGAAENLGEGAIADCFRSYAKLLRVAARLTEWKWAVKTAERDADRYLRSAIEFGKEAAAVAPKASIGAQFSALARKVEAVHSLEEGDALIRALAALPLPIPFLAHPKRERPVHDRTEAERAAPFQPEVFLEFSIDGEAFGCPHIVSPGQLHDLTVNVRVRHWPGAADRLLIHPTSVEPDSICPLPEFSLPRPTGQGDAIGKFDGRLRVSAHQSVSARPLEYCYRADFLPACGSTKPVVTGNTRLEIRSYDPALNPVSGYQEVDRKLIELRDTIRKTVLGDDRQLSDFLLVMMVLGKTAAKALRDADFEGHWEERRFQEHMRAVLRDDPRIGAALEEHPHAGGGVTDLSLRQIRIELKTENERGVDLEKALKFTNQTAQYVAGSDRRLGVLCILDCSPKKGPCGLVINDIGVARVLAPDAPRDSVPTTLGIVIVRGNLKSPSSL